MEVVTITRDDLVAADVVAFLRAHVEQLRAISPPGSSHALDLAGLRAPEVTSWVARDEAGAVAGCAALRRLDRDHGELKSMRTSPHLIRRGVASQLLACALEEAREGGLTRLSLETGAGAPFAPAHALYAAHGFLDCAPFGDYRPDPHSRFMTRRL